MQNTNIQPSSKAQVFKGVIALCSENLEFIRSTKVD